MVATGSLGLDVVLEKDGDAVEGAPHLSGLALGVESAGGLQGIRVEGEHGAMLGTLVIVAGDPAQIGGGAALRRWWCPQSVPAAARRWSVRWDRSRGRSGLAVGGAFAAPSRPPSAAPADLMKPLRSITPPFFCRRHEGSAPGGSRSGRRLPTELLTHCADIFYTWDARRRFAKQNLAD